MGLDNIPAVYPCVKQGTAVMVGDNSTINCDATQAVGGCPWMTASAGRGTSVTGMLGTDCWYRGKVGNYMLDTLQEAGYQLPVGGQGFYGVDDELSAEYCEVLGKWMAGHIEAYANEVARENPSEVKESVEQYRYAAWWLEWIAEAGDGATAWW